MKMLNLKLIGGNFVFFWESPFCSIGSLGTSGETDIVEDVHVFNCTLTETLTGVRIKTWQVNMFPCNLVNWIMQIIILDVLFQLYILQ